MGVVYRARDTRLGREVALKLLPAGFAANPARIARFQREAKVLASLEHRNVGALFDLQEIDGDHILVMQLIEGETLADRIASRPVPAGEALSVFAQIARALEAAHAKGIVHRDLKPSNVKITPEGEVKVLDFGIAQTLEDAEESVAILPDGGNVPGSDTETFHGSALGTPAFMSPEQACGRAIGPTTDIWAFGCSLFQTLTGTVPFQGETVAQIVAAILEKEPDWGLLPRDMPAELATLLRHCLQKDPARRLAGARDIAVVLEDLLAHVLDGRPDEAAVWHPEGGASVPGRAHWVLNERLGAGGSCEVWLAVHEETHLRRVFKFCLDRQGTHMLEREVVVFRMLREKLGYREDIAQVIEWQFDTLPYYIELEYAETGDIGQWTSGCGGLASVPMDMRLDVMAQVADAVAAFHAAGLEHKGLRPSAILILAGNDEPSVRIRLTGYGTSLLADGCNPRGCADLEAGGAAASMYTAPETLEGHGTTALSDVYALGVLLYQVAVGDLTRALAPGWERHVDDELIRLDIQRCVEGDPADRMQSAAALAENLRQMDGRRERHRQELERECVTERAGRRRRFIVWSGAVATLCSLLISYFLVREAEHIERESALRNMAESSERRAESSAERVQEAETVKESYLMQAREAHDRANESLRLARRIVDDSLARLSQSALQVEPELKPLRQELSESAIQYYEDIRKSRRDDKKLLADLAWTYLHVAAVGIDLETADWIDNFESGIDILEQLIDGGASLEDLGNLATGVWRASSGTVGRWPGSLKEEPDRARTACRRAVAILEKAAAAHPDVTGFQNDLAYVSFAYGHLLEETPTEALAAHQRAYEIWDRLLRAQPGVADYEYGIALSHSRIARIYDRLGARELGLRTIERSDEVFRHLLKEYPDYRAFHENWADHNFWRGLMLYDAGKYDEALESYDLSLNQYAQLLLQYPKSEVYVRFMARVYVRRGQLYQATGNREKALEEFDRALFNSETAAGAYNRAAWLMANHPNEKMRDLKRAVEFATRAVGLDPNNGRFLATLGSIQYQKGEYQAARDTITQSVALRENSRARPVLRQEGTGRAELFILAMSHCQLGEWNEAKIWYDRGVAWMEENARNDEEMQRFCDEAGKMINAALPAGDISGTLAAADHNDS